jgi:hypothetical protein
MSEQAQQAQHRYTAKGKLGSSLSLPITPSSFVVVVVWVSQSQPDI